ncbi:MAG: glycoside hydrolase family 99-like domain-containing protein [Candidatus Omnitrophica bacterium]|nr:glycoside hydrolase family 99-like domain-containing protein [Candidatus Omnitrophota bacterium]
MNKTSQSPVEIVAIYFPSWHVNDHYRAWYGENFCEWELVKSARPIYPGHHQPKIPSWGYFDESNPEWSSREIDLAANHGINVFLFDWYWYNGVRIMEEALEKGFLCAPNRKRMKFTIMWANHNWGSWPAITGIPGMGKSGIWLPIHHSAKDCDRVIDYCCAHYFSESNYWLVDGKPVFAIYDMATFSLQLGGNIRVKETLERMNERAVKNGFPGVYFIANVGCCDDNVYCCGWNRVHDAGEMGFKCVFAYNIVRTPEYETLPEDLPIVQYEDVIQSHLYAWGQIEKDGLPHYPVVTSGCDVTPRWHRGIKLPMDFRSWSYEPIIVNNTPEKFGYLCSLALRQTQKNPPGHRAVFINAWNEWTEGMYLLPEKRYGTAYLESLRNAIISETVGKRKI